MEQNEQPQLDHDKIIVLEVEYKNIAKDVNTIMTNHLPHLQAGLNRVEKKIAYWSGGIAVAISVVQIFLKLLFK